MSATPRFASPLVLALVLAMICGSSSAQDEEIRAIPPASLPTLHGGSERVADIAVAPPIVAAEEEEQEVVRIYDLSDLFTIAPPYLARQTSDLQNSVRDDLGQMPDPAMFPTPQELQSSDRGGLGGSLPDLGGGVFNAPSGESGKPLRRGSLPQLGSFGSSYGSAAANFAGARITLDDLIEAITGTIAPTQWDGVGGPGSIHRLGDALVIRCTPRIHDQIGNLLNLLRQKKGTLRTFSVEAWWLWMSEAETHALLQQGRAELGEFADVFGVVDFATFREHLGKLSEDEDRQTGYSAKITCHNGQTVHTVAGTQRLVVTQISPVADQEVFTYWPTLSLVQEGAALQVRPQATQEGTYAALDIHTRVNLLNDAQPAAAPEIPAGDDKQKADAMAAVLTAVAAIDRPHLQNARLSTSLRMPIGQVMLVGAMSFDDQTIAHGNNLCLFVKLSTQELRDDQPEDRTDELK